jgi:hypothetical protein
MSVQLVDNRTITNALLALLEATPIEIGDGDVPDGAGWQGAKGASQYKPYAVLYPLLTDTGADDPDMGSLGQPYDDGRSWYQVTCVGGDRDQCELVAGIIRRALIGARPEIEGRTVQAITCDEFVGPLRDDTTDPGEPPVFMTGDRFLVSSTPRTVIPPAET